MLEPDAIRGVPLDMDQYTRLFGTARIPTEVCFSRASRTIPLTTSHPTCREDAEWKPMMIRDTLSSFAVVNFVRPYP